MTDLIKRLRDHERHAVHDHDDDCHAAADALEEAQKLLEEAGKELAWWINEHGCCDGHQGDLPERIEAWLEPARCKHHFRHYTTGFNETGETRCRTCGVTNGHSMFCSAVAPSD